MNHRLRFLVLRRDHYRCRGCGRSPANDPRVELVIDHIKPWSRGGETTLLNLQTLCSRCNSGKSNLAWKARNSRACKRARPVENPPQQE